MKTKVLCLLLILSLIISLAACSINVTVNGGTTPAGESSETPDGGSSEAPDADIPVREALLKIEGVKSVEAIEPAEGADLFAERYLVVFEQPLDWSDPSKGTFPQRVALYLGENAEINVLETNGYCLNDCVYIGVPNVLGMDISIPETVNLVTESGNYINVEHRFFGGSRPEDMSNTGTEYWEYHTPENAANDYHRIYTALAPLLCDRWVSVGTSRGGLLTNVYAEYFPDDMDVYVPYVAPCSDGTDNDGMYKFIYGEIGNAAYGEEAAEQYRAVVTAFQVELLKNKETILPVYIGDIQEKGLLFQNETLDYGVLFDLNVLEFAVQTWQYKGNQAFGDMQAILGMPEDTNELKNQKIQALYDVFIAHQAPDDWSYNFAAWPYYVNTATYYGQYLYDFSYLRDALDKAGVADALSVTPDMDKDIPWSIIFTPEQREAFTYSPDFRIALLEDMKTTKAKHLMIFGASDPWFSQAIPYEVTNGNGNVRRYVNPDYPHDAKISNMPEETQNEIIGLLKEWLSIG